MCGGVRSIAARSACGVSPVRTAAVIRGAATPSSLGSRADAGARLGEVLVDVAAQRLERRDVDHATSSGSGAGEAFAQQLVERGEERGERLARAGRRGDQRVAAVRGSPPSRAAGPPSASPSVVGEPALDDGMERRQRRARPRPRFVQEGHRLEWKSRPEAASIQSRSAGASGPPPASASMAAPQRADVGIGAERPLRRSRRRASRRLRATARPRSAPPARVRAAA